MYRAPGPTRKRTAAAISSGNPCRPASVFACMWCWGTGPSRTVAMIPGETQFTVTFAAAKSCASALVNPTSPAFAAMTCGRPFAPVWAAMPPRFTMAPSQLRSRWGKAALAVRNAPSRITDVTARKSAYVSSANGFSGRAAALLTRMSMRPNRSTVAATRRATDASSETSASTAIASPPFDAISETTASRLARFDRPLTATFAPPSARASAMALPMFFPAPVTIATRPDSSFVIASTSQGFQLHCAIEERAQRLERRGGLLAVEAARSRVRPELLLDVRPGERFASPAAQVRLALLDDAPVPQARPQVSRELPRVGIRGIDPVAHLGGEPADVGIVRRIVAERVETDVSPEEPGGDAVGSRELRRVSVWRPLLVRERLPEPVHGSLPDVRNDLVDVARRDALAQPARTVDVRLDHRPARVRLECQGRRHPLLAESVEERAVVPFARPGEPVEEAVRPLEDRARSAESGPPEERRAQSGLRRPAGVQPLRPGPFREVLDDAARHRSGDPERVDELVHLEAQRARHGRRSHVSRTFAGMSCSPWIRSASSSATAMSDPAPELHAPREPRDAVGGDEDDGGEDQHGEPEDGDGGEIAALVEVEDKHRQHLGFRSEEDHRSGQLAHDCDEDEAPGGDEARAEERSGHPA